jgi:hypothetical protein
MTHRQDAAPWRFIHSIHFQIGLPERRHPAAARGMTVTIDDYDSRSFGQAA